MEVSDYCSQWFLNFVVQYSLIEQRILTGTHQGTLVKRGPAGGGGGSHENSLSLSEFKKGG